MSNKVTEAFKAKLATNPLHIKLTSNISVDFPLTIPQGVEIIPGAYKFINKGGKILFFGHLEAGRRQVFDGFAPGEVKGIFGGDVFPEWWGLTPNNHDIAINSAIQAGMQSNYGNTISLAAGQYYINKSIDLRESLSQLIGKGSGATQILASPDFNPEFVESSFWSNGISIPQSHSALIWIGSKSPHGGQSFRTNIKGVAVSGYHAVRKWPDKRISIISSTGYVEENHIIEDVLLGGFSGFGVGFHHPQSISTVNGLALRNFWITDAVKRDSVPIYIPPHASVCSIRSGTIDCRTHKEQTQHMVPPPSFVQDWPQFGILCGGAGTIIDGVHLEGMGNGIHVMASSTPSSVDISNVHGIHMMDSNMGYYNDPNRVLGYPPALSVQEATDPHSHKFYFEYGAIVSIGKSKGESAAGFNYNSCVNVRNIRSFGGCKYLLRDWGYGVEHTTIGNSRDPNSDAAAMVSYSRGIPYSKPSGTYPNLTVQWYDKKNPLTDKEYFRGPM